MKKKTDLPAMPFYVGDWFKCTEVRALRLDYRALWFDMLCYLWESTERGVMVKPNGKPYNDKEIIQMVGLDADASGRWLQVLIDDEVCSRRDDAAIYSRRMVKDERIRKMRKETGSKGGNPALLKQKDKLNTEDEIETEGKNESVIGIVTNVENPELEPCGVTAVIPNWAVNFKNYRPAIVYPFEHEQFGAAWDYWIKYRMEQNYGSYKPIGEQNALSGLANKANDDMMTALEIIKQSIENGYKGLFEIKGNGKKSKQPATSDKDLAQIINYFYPTPKD